MSMFCGIFHPDGKSVDRDELNKITKTLALWQPEKEFQFIEGNLGVSHWHRYSTPESLNLQLPIKNNEQQFLLGSNLRLDNRTELAEKLAISPHDAKAMTDEAFVLAAYQKWGEDCPKYLLGDFVFVIWDAKKQQLFMARDPLGFKIIYYYYVPNKLFVFASNIRPVYEHSEVPIEFNERSLALRLGRDKFSHDKTFYQNILKLRTGHSLTIDSKSNFKLKQYWNIYKAKKVRYKTNQEYYDHFNEIFTDAVKQRLRSHFPVASHLSGGLDSSSVVAVAAKLLKEENKHIVSYGLIPAPNKKIITEAAKWTGDDSEFMESLVEQYDNIDLQKVMIGEQSVFHHISSSNQYADGPIRNIYNRLWIDKICHLALESGARSILTGQMGNATLSWKGQASAYAGMKQSIKNLAFMPATMLAKWALRIENPWNKVLFNKQFLKDQQLYWPQFISPYFRLGNWSVNSFVLLCTRLMGVYTIHEAVHGIEHPDPTGDTRLIEFCAQIPNHLYKKKTENRLLVKNALKGVLPDKVRLRKTQGRQYPEWYYQFDEEKKLFSQMIGKIGGSQYAKYLDIAKLNHYHNNWPERYLQLLNQQLSQEEGHKKSREMSHNYRCNFCRHLLSYSYWDDFNQRRDRKMEEKLMENSLKQNWETPIIQNEEELCERTENGNETPSSDALTSLDS